MNSQKGEKEYTEKVAELDEKKLSLQGIAKKLDEPIEDIREIIITSPKMSERLKKIALESEAFDLFEKGKTPKRLVKEGFCDLERAESIYEKFLSFRETKEEDEDEKGYSKLSTQVGLLGSRLAQLEIKIMDSSLLPKTFECKNCGYEDRYAVAMVCKRCENVTLKTLDSMPKNIAQTKILSNNIISSDDDSDGEEDDKEEA